jgi:hypothetical protein
VLRGSNSCSGYRGVMYVIVVLVLMMGFGAGTDIIEVLDTECKVDDTEIGC